MTDPEPQPRPTMRATLASWIQDSGGLAIAFVGWSIVILITIVATAQSSKPWDTAIAAGAAISQAFFAFVVWRLGQAQFAFTQRITDRQHKIDAYPLRDAVAHKLNALSSHIGAGVTFVPRDSVVKFEDCYIEIARLFSNEAGSNARELWKAVQLARKQTHTVYVNTHSIFENKYGSVELTDDGKATVAEARLIFSKLIIKLEDEMRIM